MHIAVDSEDDSDVVQADKVLVGGAGTTLANGTYVYAGVCDEVGKYAREAELVDASGHSASVVCFTLYRCRLNNGVRRWYISIVPPNLEPGTSQVGGGKTDRSSGDRFASFPFVSGVLFVSSDKERRSSACVH